MRKVFVFSLCLLVAGFLGPAGAVVVTSLPGGTVIPMPEIGYWGGGPQVFDGVVWSSWDGALFGWNGYGFGTNGYWDGSLGPMAGVARQSDTITYTMTFAFDTPVSGVGGFMNYLPNDPMLQPIISIWDSSNNLIESYGLSFNTGGVLNSGFFYGFLEDSANIKYFTLSNAYIGITNLTTTTSPVPIPSTLLLLGSGLAGLVGIGRRRMKK